MNSVNPHQFELQPTRNPAPQKQALVFTILAALLAIAFAGPLWSLVRLALKTEIQSHILLIPFVSLYLWKAAKSADSNPKSTSALRTPRSALKRSLLPALVAAICGLTGIVAYWVLGKSGRIAHNDALSLATASFWSFLLAAALGTLGWQTLRPRLFAIAFLVFMIPLPLALLEFISIGLQLASAEAADWMLSLTGMPMFRDGMVFQFPGSAVRVAEECSGVRSTLVLFIISLLAGHLFLRTGWKKALLVLAVFPLGILRNGFRITVISWLTVNVDAGIIDSPLHHHGGPIFFVLSLVPFFAVLWMLRRSDFRRGDSLSASNGKRVG